MLLSRRSLEISFVVCFVAIHFMSPLLIGERYPFTISPMFSDQPEQYCTYEVRSRDGRLLDPEPFGLHLVYDGNPPGLGMGIVPPPTLHGFGEIASEAEVRQQVQAALQTMPADQLDAVIVTQQRASVRGHQVVREQLEWEIER